MRQRSYGEGRLQWLSAQKMGGVTHEGGWSGQWRFAGHKSKRNKELGGKEVGGGGFTTGSKRKGGHGGARCASFGAPAGVQR